MGSGPSVIAADSSSSSNDNSNNHGNNNNNNNNNEDCDSQNHCSSERTNSKKRRRSSSSNSENAREESSPQKTERISPQRRRISDANSSEPQTSNATSFETTDERMADQSSSSSSNNGNEDETLTALRNDLEEVERGLNQRLGILFSGFGTRSFSENPGETTTGNNNDDENENDNSNQQHSNGGRALFDSIGSALGNIRGRLQVLTGSVSGNESSGDNDNGSQQQEQEQEQHSTTASTASGEARDSPSPPSPSQSPSQSPSPPIEESIRALSRRLETAERSHSTRIPLGLLVTREGADPAEASPGRESTAVPPATPPPGDRRSMHRRSSSFLLASRRGNRDDRPSSSPSPSTSAPETRNAMLLADASFSSSRTLAASIRLAEGSSLPTLVERSSSASPRARGDTRYDTEPPVERDDVGGDDDDEQDADSVGANPEKLLLPDSARTSLAGDLAPGTKSIHRRGSGMMRVLSQDLMLRFASATEDDTDEEEDRQEHDSKTTDGDNDEKPEVALATATATATATASKPELYVWGSLSFKHASSVLGDEEEDPDSSKSQSSQTSYRFFGTEAEIPESNGAPASSPRLVPSSTRLGRSKIVSMDASENHCAFVTSSGRLLICGNNKEGAVDPSARHSGAPFIARPTHLETGLGMNRIQTVACGKHHTAVVTETGTVLTWGSNHYGQLGHRRARCGSSSNDKSTGFCYPKAFVMAGRNGVAAFAKRAASVACGEKHTLVLTTRMEVYVCGGESIDNLRQSSSEADGSPPVFPMPGQNPALRGLPLVGIASGPSHFVVWTAHGTAFAWGTNKAGQCGREFPRTLATPVPIGVPRSSLTPKAASSLVLVSASLENWNRWGPTGAGGNEPVLGLASDVRVVDAACGRDHTVLVTESGRLLVCGSNDCGQLGIAPNESLASGTRSCPGVQPVEHPDPERRFECVEAGTSHSVALDDAGCVWQIGNGEHPIQRVSFLSHRDPPESSPPVSSIASGGSMHFAISRAVAGSDLATPGEPCTMPSMPGLNDLMEAVRAEEGSIQEKNGAGPSSHRSSREDLARRTEELFRSPAVMNSLFMDPREIDGMYQTLICGSQTREVRQAMASSIETGMLMGLKSTVDSRLMYFESVRFLLLYLQCPIWRDETIRESNADDDKENEPAIVFDARGDLLFLLCETILGLPFEGYKAFLAWSATVYGEELFVPFLVRPLVHQLNHRLVKNITHGVPMIAGVLLWLHTVNERSDSCLARAEDFHCSGLENMPTEALFEDLAKYHTASDGERSSNFFLAAHPFLMAPTVKQQLLQVEHQMSMVQAAQAAGVSFDQRTRQFEFKPYFVLAIDRKYLLPQTLDAVAKASTGELRKSLKVVFKGEDGIDAGGVTKEFFQLLCEKLFDVNTGMWTISEHNETWFNPDCSWNGDGFYLVGVLCGLAVYNSVILDVHFPHAIYRKLLGLDLGLEDLIDKDVRKGLQSLLDYDGDGVEHIFCLNFEVSWMEYGQERKKELKPEGSNIAVTSDNKEEYVMLYVKWLLVDSIASQYNEFERGFNQVMADSSLDILTADELELLVTGTPVLDFRALEQSCEYEGGFDPDSAVVKNIWRWVQSATLSTQEKFLRFCTGSSKGPIGGLGKMPFKIQRAGPDSPQLPTSHTCFNTLIIPDYGDDYDKLTERLGRAVIECEGFGLQ